MGGKRPRSLRAAAQDGNERQFFSGDPTADQRISTMNADLGACLDYLLEGEAETVANNAENPVTAWNRLRHSQDPQTDSHVLVDVQKMVRPERAKSTKGLLEYIEKWEERLRKLPPDQQPKDTMKAAILVGLCPASMAEHL